MEQLTQVIVAVDGSPVSEKPLQLATYIVGPAHIPLTGIFVIDSKWPDFIGHDWQSSCYARQGFLDYVHQQQEHQAHLAHSQFEQHTQALTGARFVKQVGDPTEIMIQLANSPQTSLLILSRDVFQICGRPSSRHIAQQVVNKASRPVLFIP